ncbi:MAG: AtpZ/AtpI family protein [Deltaproteobacteria bacterium]|nr:AtpZ/AtpI family protein [Deltaproteobacteria bacterium]
MYSPILLDRPYFPVLARPALAAKKQKEADPLWLAFGIYGSVGLQLAAAVVGGLLLGDYLDGRWQTGPWMALTGLILGSIGGFVNLMRILDWNQKRRNSKFKANSSKHH